MLFGIDRRSVHADSLFLCSDPHGRDLATDQGRDQEIGGGETLAAAVVIGRRIRDEFHCAGAMRCLAPQTAEIGERLRDHGDQISNYRSATASRIPRPIRMPPANRWKNRAYRGRCLSHPPTVPEKYPTTNKKQSPKQANVDPRMTICIVPWLLPLSIISSSTKSFEHDHAF